MSNSGQDKSRIVRGRHSQFAAIPAETMHDNRLTMQAHAVLHYMIFRAGINGWEFRVRDIAQHFNTGKKGGAVHNAINELIEFGYVVREITRNELGHITGTLYIVNEISESTPGFKRPAAQDDVQDDAPSAPAAAPAPQPAAPVAAPVVVQEQPAPTTEAPAKTKKPRPAKPDTSAERAEMHHRILAAWNGIKGRMPGRRARKTDGKYIADKRLARLIDEFVTVTGGEEEAIETLKRATVVWNRELDDIPGGWLERSATIELVFSQGHSKGGERVAPRAPRVQQMPAYVAPDVI